MSHMKPREVDENEEAARVVRRATNGPAPMHDNVEAAWEAWSRQIQGVDARTRTLLRAAFEAGAEVGPLIRSRAGGLKGGAARASSLSPKRKSSIARTAAKARWNKR